MAILNLFFLFSLQPADDHHADHADDGDIDHEATIMEVPQMPDFDDLNEPQENVNESVHEIRKTMHNAPEMVTIIHIQKTAATISART